MSIDQFGKALVASGLLTAEEVKALWAGLPAEGRPKEGDGFAQALVAAGKLTKFQAQELLAGRGGGLIMGDYVLLAEIGAGGMGKVYKAQHRRMKRVVALKVMSSAAMQDDAAVKRFQREVEAAARLEHPNIVTAYDSGEAGKVKYLVMQFVDGGDLSDHVKKNGPLPIEAAVGYVIQAARGLAFAHAAGVVHRDIKPANLLLDKKGVVKILDMGLARIEDGDGLTATEQVMGTVDYMSPEQAAETKNADSRSDIYSLGCTLWYLLTAKKLYDGDTMISRLMKHRDAELPSLVKTRDDVSWPLEQVFHKMIAKRPQDRQQLMDEVVAALEPFAPGGGSSSGGMGSSIGGGKGQSAELASFMQAMAGGGPKSSASVAAQASKPATSASVDATAAFSAAEVGTDPKSALHTRGLPQPSVPRKKSPPVKLIAGGLFGAAAVLIAGIIVTIKNKDGEVVAELNAPAGASVEIKPTAGTPIVATPASSMLTGAQLAALLDSPEYRWSEPENLGGVNSSVNDKLVGVSVDESSLFLVRDGKQLMSTTRRGADLPFPAPQPFPGGDLLGISSSDVAISADGLTLALLRSSPNRALLWGERRSTSEPFSPLRELPQSDRLSAGHPAISADGLTLLAAAGGGEVYMWTRPALGRPFDDAQRVPSPVSGREWDMPTYVSSDRLLMIVMGQIGEGAEQWRQARYFSRADVRSPFAAGKPLPVPLGTADGNSSNTSFLLSQDGQKIYFSTPAIAGGLGGHDIWVSRRVPKSSSQPTAATQPASLAVADLLESPDYEWSEPENLGSNVNTSGGEFSATLSADELCLIFHGDGAPGGKSNLWECRRPSIDQPFGPRQRLTGSAYEFDASLSADGLTLFYETHAVPAGRVAKDLRTRTRTTRDGPWSPPATVELDADHDDQTPWMSDDGATLIFSSNRPGSLGPADLWLARREAPDAPFSQVTRLGNGINTPASEQYGRILADGRTIQFVRDGKPHLTFTSPTGVTSALPMRGVGDDVRAPWISADGRRLYFHSNRPGGQGGEDLWTMRRVPKGATLPEPVAGARPAGRGTIADMFASPDYEWSKPENIGPTINGPMNDDRVSLTEDQLRIRFSKGGDSGPREAARTSTTAPFGTPLPSINVKFPWLSGDGLTLVCVGKAPDGTTDDLHLIRRATTESKWEERTAPGPEVNQAGSEYRPTLSPDGLTLVFNRDSDLWISRRVSPDKSFGPAAKIDPHVNNSEKNEYIGRLLADNQTFVFCRENEWYFTFTSPTGVKSALSLNGAPFEGTDVWIAGDGMSAYFAAELPGGFGDRDIWVTRRVPKSDVAESPVAAPPAASANAVYLDDLPEVEARTGYGTLGKHGNLAGPAVQDTSVVWHGAPVAHALWMHPTVGEVSFVRYRLDGHYATFAAEAGIQEGSGGDAASPVMFRVLGDGRELWKSAPLQKQGKSTPLSVDVRGVRELRLETSCGDQDGRCHATWFLPRLTPISSGSQTVSSPPPPAVFPFDAATAVKHQEAWAKHLGIPVEFTNDVGMKFRLIPPGEFQMGLGPEFTDEELKRLTSEKNDPLQKRLRSSRPAHPVRITRPFYMEVEEVTVGRYRDVVGQLRPEMETDPGKPLANYVTFADAITFCNKLSEREKKRPAYRMEGEQITLIDDADGYRLPTEAQWEYACRAGTNTFWYFGNDGGGVELTSDGDREFRRRCLAPNPFGLSALYAGSNEWCWDGTTAAHDMPYSPAILSRRDDPREDVGTHRIKRGGGNSDGGGAGRRSINSFARNSSPAAEANGGLTPYSGFGRVVLPIIGPDPAAAAQTSTENLSQPPAADGVYLDDLSEIEFRVGRHSLGKHGKFADQQNPDGRIKWRGAAVEHALWMHPTPGNTSFVRYQLAGQYATFSADAGLSETPANQPASPVSFRVLGDGRELWKSTPLQKRGESLPVALDVRGVQELRLETSCGDNNGSCHTTWFYPRLTKAAAVSVATSPPTIPAEALTFNGHRYFLVDCGPPGTPLLWDQARAQAEAMGGHLAAINSQAEYDWVRNNIWLKRPKTTLINSRMFLGASTAANSIEWKWVTGELLDRSLWTNNFPGAPSRDLVLVWVPDGKSETWHGATRGDFPGGYYLVEWDTLGPAISAVNPQPLTPNPQTPPK